MRIRSAAVVLMGDDVLLIVREKDGHGYCVLPGGAVEEGETLEAACLRELHEETGLIGRVMSLLPVPVDLDVPAFYLRVAVDSRDVRLGEPEASRSSAGNTYVPQWVAVSDLGRHNLVPEHAHVAINIASSLGS